VRSNIVLNLRKYPWLRFLAPDLGGASGGGAPSGAAAPSPGTGDGAVPVDGSMIDYLPGGELLRGATENKPTEAELKEWGPDDDEEAGDGANTGEARPDTGKGEAKAKEGETPAEGKEGEQAPALEIPEDWPEEAKTRFASLAQEKETIATEKAALVTEKETLTAKVSELETKVAATPAPVLAPTRANPLAHVRDEKGLEVNANFARSLKSFALKSLANGGEMPRELQAELEGVKPTEIKEPRTVTAEEAHAMYENAEAMLNERIPQRRQYLAEECQAQAELVNLAPEMLKADTEEGKIYAAFLQQFPEAKLISRWPTMIAATVLGHLALDARAKAAKEAKEKKISGGGPAGAPAKPHTPIAPVPPTPPNGGGAAPKISKPGKATQLSASMDAEDLASLM
jgi:hypothetical protein